MKKMIALILCCCMAVSLAACGGNDTGNTANTAAATQTTGVKDVLEAGIAEAEGTTDNAAESAADDGTEAAAGTDDGTQLTASAETNGADERQSGVDETAHKPEEDVAGVDVSGDSGDVDVDLTSLSSTLIYSEVYNMLSYPEDYLGKTVKMDGLFNYFHDQNTDVYYFACIIEDATACCSQGIEFVRAGDFAYPEDYPEVGDKISVTGTFDTYMEGEYQYCTLRDAEMEVL